MEDMPVETCEDISYFEKWLQMPCQLSALGSQYDTFETKPKEENEKAQLISQTKLSPVFRSSRNKK